MRRLPTGRGLLAISVDAGGGTVEGETSVTVASSSALSSALSSSSDSGGGLRNECRSGGDSGVTSTGTVCRDGFDSVNAANFAAAFGAAEAESGSRVVRDRQYSNPSKPMPTPARAVHIHHVRPDASSVDQNGNNPTRTTVQSAVPTAIVRTPLTSSGSTGAILCVVAPMTISCASGRPNSGTRDDRGEFTRPR